MRKLIFGALLLILIAGCATTDYPVITDDRGSYSGIIRTGHKAYQIPSGQVATIWPDGTDELYTLIYQNNYGDQKLYTYNNYDPTATVMFLDQTYCDWLYFENQTNAEIAIAWNPHDPLPDDVFDYQYFPDAAGARSLSLLVSYTSRLGECGDAGFWAQKQNLFTEFGSLNTTTWRGGTAYVLPIHSGNTVMQLNGTQVPLYGQFTGFITDRQQLILPMTPNAQHQLSWLAAYISANGPRASLAVTYNSVSAVFDVRFAPNGVNYNRNRF